MPTIYRDEIKHISERKQNPKPAVKRQKLVFTHAILEYEVRIVPTKVSPESYTYVWQVSDIVFAASAFPNDEDPSLYVGKWVDE